MGHTAVSATQASSGTLWIWQHGPKEKQYSKFETFQIADSQYKDKAFIKKKKKKHELLKSTLSSYEIDGNTLKYFEVHKIHVETVI